MNLPGKKARFFYGWVIVANGLITMIFIYGTRHSFPVFFTPILKEFGWSRGNTSIMLSLNIFAYGFLAPLAGILAARWRPRMMVSLGIVIMSLGTLGCALAQQLWHFYFLFGILMSLGAAFSGWPVLAPALINWFERRRGLVLGLSQMGAGLSLALSLLLEFFIQKMGWRNAYLILSGVLILFLLPLSLIFFYYHPRDKGLKAYGAGEGNPVPMDPRVEAAMPRAVAEWAVGQIFRNPRLWFLFTAYALFSGMGGYMVMTHQVRFSLDVGFSSIFSVSIFALSGIMLSIGQISGFLSDWIGREKAATLACCLCIMALTWLLCIRNPSQFWLLYLHAVCFGLGAGMFAPTFFASAADIFPGRRFGFVAGLMLTGQGIGGIVGPWLGGHLFDITGNYTSAFVLCMISFALACILLWIAAPRKAARERA
jgi:MFS family permease